jgi:hypothetical protein
MQKHKYENMQECIHILKAEPKGRHRSWEPLHTYKCSKNGLTRNETYTTQNNILFEPALK